MTTKLVRKICKCIFLKSFFEVEIAKKFIKQHIRIDICIVGSENLLQQCITDQISDLVKVIGPPSCIAQLGLQKFFCFFF